MISREQAENRILDYLNKPYKEGKREDRFVISHIELSSKNDYWIIQANSEAYVNNNDFSRCYVGVNAYLMDVKTGEIERVSSGWSVEYYLRDKYDERAASGKTYVLKSTQSADYKKAIIKMRQLLDIGMSDARRLISGDCIEWFQGKKRYLLIIQEFLNKRNLLSEIVLRDKCDKLPKIEDFGYFIDLPALFRKRIECQQIKEDNGEKSGSVQV